MPSAWAVRVAAAWATPVAAAWAVRVAATGVARSTLRVDAAQIKAYVFEDEDFEDTFRQWAVDNAHRIDLSMGPEEHKLEYTDLHREVCGGGSFMGHCCCVTPPRPRRCCRAVHRAVQ